jgi:hypothetical protein
VLTIPFGKEVANARCHVASLRNTPNMDHLPCNVTSKGHVMGVLGRQRPRSELVSRSETLFASWLVASISGPIRQSPEHVGLFDQPRLAEIPYARRCASPPAPHACNQTALEGATSFGLWQARAFGGVSNVCQNAAARTYFGQMAGTPRRFGLEDWMTLLPDVPWWASGLCEISRH